MISFLHPYHIVSRVIGVLLMGAGLLKARHSFESTPGLVGWSDAFITSFELLFGAWLLFGLYPRLSRIIALLCFITF